MKPDNFKPIQPSAESVSRSLWDFMQNRLVDFTDFMVHIQDYLDKQIES